MRKIIFVLILLSSFVVSADYTQIPVSEYPGGSLWLNKSSITISEKIELSGETHIRADELIITKPIVTEGNFLHIDVRRLIFKDEGKIVAFDKPAQDGVASQEQGQQGERGANFSGNDDDNDKYHGDEKDGGQGAPGKAPERPGPPGDDGNQDPGEILIFAAKVEGRPIIDGTGQTGGKGGRGAQGGKGGAGGNGSVADMNWHGGTKRAGLGGAGGIGGSGGVGGQGGQGGRAVRVTFFVGLSTAQTDFSGVTSTPGAGGAPGEYGPRGPFGDHGNPGSSDHNVWGGEQDAGSGYAQYNPAAFPEPPVHVTTLPAASLPGEHARPGLLSDKASCPEGVPESQCRKSGDVFIRAFSDFENQRFAVYKAWYAFHWARALNLLVRDSLRLARHVQLSREQFGSLPDAQVLADLNKQSVDSIIAAWKNNFIAPLEQAPRGTPLSGNVDEMKSIARAVVSLLDGTPDLAKLAALRDSTSDELQQSLDAALFACSRYNQLKTDLLSLFFGATKHYIVPVCSGVPNFADPKNIAARIELTVPFTADVTPKELSDRLLPRPDAGGVHAALRRWGLQSAFAGDAYHLVYVHDVALTLPRILESEPVSPPNTSASGLLLGYGAPDESGATIANLPALLRALAIELGAQG